MSTESGSVPSSRNHEDRDSHRMGGLDYQQRHVRLTDRKLLDLAARTASKVDWPSLMRSRRRPTTVSRRSARPNVDNVVITRSGSNIAVVASAVVPCSVAELRSIIRPPATVDYAATMREMFGHEFVYGAVVHRVEGEEPESAPPTLAERAVSGKPTSRVAGSNAIVTPQPASAIVKTITFAKRHFLALSEQWCVLDAEHKLNTCRDGFAVTMTSLNPDDVFSGKTHADSVSALTNVTAAYTVVPEDTRSPSQHQSCFSKTNVRVTIQVEGNVREGTQSTTTSSVTSFRRLQQGLSQRAVTNRLKELAVGTVRLTEVVPARRLNAQVFVDPRAVAAAIPPSSKTRCACCTKRFMSASRRKQCHLCGFFVCASCSIVHELQRARVRRYLVRVCHHCTELVDDGCYDNLSVGVATTPPSIVPDAPESESSARALERALTEVLTSASTSPTRKAAVKSVIRFLSDQPGDSEEHVRQTLSASSTPSRTPRRLTVDSSDAEHLEALAQYSSQHEDPPLSSCVLASSRTRTYPLVHKSGGTGTPVRERVPEAPPAPDEEERVRWLELLGPAHDRIKNLPELEVLCELARKELDCELGMVTTVTRDEMHVVATSNPMYRGLVFPREQSFCTHTIMNQRLPVLVPHPEADVRYNRQDGVRGPSGARFYFGFPLHAPGRDQVEEGPVIGTFCCSNGETRTVTRAQYAAMERLARNAERVLQRAQTNTPSADGPTASTVQVE